MGVQLRAQLVSCARQESNLHQRRRRPTFYPLDYERILAAAVFSSATKSIVISFRLRFNHFLIFSPGFKQLGSFLRGFDLSFLL